MKGVSNKIIEIDLSHESYQICTISNHDYKMYIGSKELGIKSSEVDPMESENMIAFTCGPLIGTDAPCTGRFSAITKSPRTGIIEKIRKTLAESYLKEKNIPYRIF